MDKKITNVLDANGVLLVPGKEYLHQGKILRVLDESYGPGNPRLPYYRVICEDKYGEEKIIIVDAKYPGGSGGVYGGVIFQSRLVPTE
ncbi:MAG: hypothetical protein NT098_05820 [Candidatus Parcubacteria bacterium]|nr:hypothetical protein [Candidatus Parcubacteria bacterium]